MRVWLRLKMLEESSHQIIHDRSHDRIEVVGGQIIDTEFESPQSLAHQIRPRTESYDERPHEMAEMGQEVTQSGRYRESQFDVEISVMYIACALQQMIEGLQ
jgi:hypothetical protein